MQYINSTNEFPTYFNRWCPNCDDDTSNKRDLFEVVAKQPAETTDFTEISKRFVGFSDEQIFFSYVRCEKCSILYNSIYFSAEQLETLYKSMPDNGGGENLEHLSRTQRGYVRTLSLDKTTSGNWLDLGADIGLFAAELRAQAPNIVVNAIEPNIDVHAVLQESIGQSGIISTGWADMPEQRYLGISAIHVLDHLVDLKTELLRIANHLEVGGVFIAVVHNEKSFMRKILRKKWPPFCLQHPQLFSPLTLSKTLGCRI